jgi:hypothetical protein
MPRVPTALMRLEPGSAWPRWYVRVPAIDAGVGQRLVEQPPGGADERLALPVLLVAGLLPTNTIRAASGPSPNTVCVAGSHSSQARHPLTALRRLPSPRPVSGCAGTFSLMPR